MIETGMYVWESDCRSGCGREGGREGEGGAGYGKVEQVPSEMGSEVGWLASFDAT